jgi:uncharacterized membrane protein (DUF485 family)
MPQDFAQRVAAHPAYQELKRKRTRFGLWLTAAMMLVYYGFILLVAFDKPLLAKPLGSLVTTVGMPLGLAVIVFTVAITAYYVNRANGEFDRLSDTVRDDMARGEQA